MEAVSLVIGAAIAAAFGYAAWLVQRRQESVERRAALLELLATELQLFGAPPQAHDPTKAFYRDPITLVSVDQLLAPGTLSPARNSELFKGLVLLKASLSKYNDYVRMTNLAQATTPIPDGAHTQMYSTMVKHYSQLLDVRIALQPLLEGEGHEGALLVEGGSDEVDATSSDVGDRESG